MDLPPVSQTALLTLRARADEHRRPSPLFNDPWAAAWSDKLPWPPELSRWYNSFAQAKTAIRAHQIDQLILHLTAGEPAAVVELGCGFSTRSRRLERSSLHWYHLDLPEVMASRRALEADDPSPLATSVLSSEWISVVQKHLSARLILVAEGLWYYLPKSQVDALFSRLMVQLPGAYVIFDLVGRQDFKRSAAWSRKLGAPILWQAEGWEAIQGQWGLKAVPGLEQLVLVARTIAGFEARYGPIFGAGLKFLAHWPSLRARASGLVVSQLGEPLERR